MKHGDDLMFNLYSHVCNGIFKDKGFLTSVTVQYHPPRLHAPIIINTVIDVKLEY